MVEPLTVSGHLPCAELPTQRKGGEAVDTLYCIKLAVCRAVKTIVNTPPLMILAIAAIAKLIA